MKKTLFLSLLSLCLSAALAPRVATPQRVADRSEVTLPIKLPVGEQNVTIAPDKLPKVNKPAPGRTNAGARPVAGSRRTTDVAGREVPRAEDRPATLREVETLAKQFGLHQPTKLNPQLAFDAEEFAYWHTLKLSEPELQLRFAAARAILDAADAQHVPIRDQKTLAGAASNLVLIARRGGDTTPTGITSADRRGEIINALCEGDSSQQLLKQAWDSLNAGRGQLGEQNLEKALVCAGGVIDGWAEKADEQQAERFQSGNCKKTPPPKERDAYFTDYWALSDVASAWFIRGRVFALRRKWTEAKEAYKVVSEKYPCAYTWDPSGPWFWRTAEGAERESRKLP